MAKNAARTSNKREYAAARNASVRSSGAAGYVDGTAARRLRPREEYEEPEVRTAAERSARPNRQVSRTTQRNREKATRMNVGFVIFLTVVSLAILISAIRYLQVKSDLITIKEEAEVLESQLSQLKEDNDALYSQVTSSVDLSEIKKDAMGRLGMTYPTKEQIETYETSRSSYVRQYQDVPDTR